MYFTLETYLVKVLNSNSIKINCSNITDTCTHVYYSKFNVCLSLQHSVVECRFSLLSLRGASAPTKHPQDPLPPGPFAFLYLRKVQS